MEVLSIVFPVFGVVLVGYLYARRHAPDMSAANRVNLDVFVPALVFHVVASRDFRPMEFLGLALGGALVVFGSGLVGLIAARLLRMDWRTLVPPMMFVNSGNMGLPLALLAFGQEGLAAALVLFLIENVLHFTVGLKMLDRRASMLGVLRMPLMLATFAGLAVSWLRVPIPAAVATAVEMLSQISIPLMLFSLGVRLREADPRLWRVGLLGAVLRPASGLAVALLFLWAVGLPGQLPEQLILFAVLPPAVLNFMLAEKYRQEPTLVAAIVIWGNLASLVLIPVTLAAIGR